MTKIITEIITVSAMNQKLVAKTMVKEIIENNINQMEIACPLVVCLIARILGGK